MSSLKTPPPAIPAAGEIKIWSTDLGWWSGREAELQQLLSPSELQRLDRLRIPKKKDQFLVSRGLLRLLLSLMTGEAPQRVDITLTPWGKPFLPGGAVQFSLSHSGSRILFGFASGTPIGIDIQEIYPISHLERIIQRYFSPAERDYVMNLTPGRRVEAFFELWAAKESYLKAGGSGFQAQVRGITILPDRGQAGFSVLQGAAGSRCAQSWSIRNLAVEPGFKACAAVPGGLTSLRIYPLHPG